MPIFELRSWKGFDQGIAGEQWYNSYMVQLGTVMHPLEANHKVMRFVHFEAFNHLPTVNFKRVTLRELKQFNQDPQDNAFDVWHPNIWGQRFIDPNDPPLPTQWGMEIKKNLPIGRTGHIVWRNTHTEKEIMRGTGGRSTMLMGSNAQEEGWRNGLEILEIEDINFWCAPKWNGWGALGTILPVVHIQRAGSIQLNSLLDAQVRKSQRGRDAHERAILGCQYLAHMSQIIRQNAINEAGDVLKGDMGNLLPYDIEQGSHCAAVKEYFEMRATVTPLQDGASGWLDDVHFQLAAQASTSWEQRLQDLSTELNTVMEPERLVIPAGEILGVRLKVIACSKFAEITLLSRFL